MTASPGNASRIADGVRGNPKPPCAHMIAAYDALPPAIRAKIAAAAQGLSVPSPKNLEQTDARGPLSQVTKIERTPKLRMLARSMAGPSNRQRMGEG
jgi:hypothetical protein